MNEWLVSLLHAPHMAAVCVTHSSQQLTTPAKLIANSSFPSDSRSLWVPTSTSSWCRLSFNAKHRIENVRLELQCHPENSTKVRGEIQSYHRYVRNDSTHNKSVIVYPTFSHFQFRIISLTDLNLSNNQINKLPDELADLTQLLRLDISHNLFLSLPHVVFKMPKLRQLKANNNAIIGEYKFSSISRWPMATTVHSLRSTKYTANAETR